MCLSLETLTSVIGTDEPILVELIDLVISNYDSHTPALLDVFRADWDGLCEHLLFKLGASAVANEFCEWVQVTIDVYIPHRKYQVKPHSYPWFSVGCVAAIAHRNHFFRL